jgi:tripartite-type tricarboxylate transporter receptor subunit TctC
MRAIERHIRSVATIAAVAILTMGKGPAVAADALFAGKTINLYIGSGAGGGYDFFGRLVARHLGRNIPGQPNVVPQNMPGAGSIRAFNYVYNVAPKDGTALVIGSPSVTLIEALDSQGVRFKTARLNWIGRISSIVQLTYTWHTSPTKTIEDAMRRETLIGGIAATSPLSVLPAMLDTVVGTKLKLITGYADSNATMVAAERGEVEGTTVSWNTLKVSKQNWLRDKSVSILVQYALKRHPDLAEVPAAVELGKTPEDRQVLGLYVGAADVGYSIATSPDVPTERVQMLRQGFEAMLADPEFLADVTRTKIEFDPLPGAALQKLVEESSNISPAVLQRARAMSPGG